MLDNTSLDSSGAVYSVLLIILIALWATASKAMFIFLNPVSLIFLFFTKLLMKSPTLPLDKPSNCTYEPRRNAEAADFYPFF